MKLLLFLIVLGNIYAGLAQTSANNAQSALDDEVFKLFQTSQAPTVQNRVEYVNKYGELVYHEVKNKIGSANIKVKSFYDDKDSYRRRNSIFVDPVVTIIELSGINAYRIYDLKFEYDEFYIDDYTVIDKNTISIKSNNFEKIFKTKPTLIFGYRKYKYLCKFKNQNYDVNSYIQLKEKFKEWEKYKNKPTSRLKNFFGL